MLEVKVSLRIYSKTYNLSEASARLKSKEDFGYSKGDKIGLSANKYYDETMWGKNSTCSAHDDIGTHVMELLDWLDQRKYEFEEVIKNSDVKSDLFCYLSSDNGQGGGAFSSDVIKIVTTFDLDIILDVSLPEKAGNSG